MIPHTGRVVAVDLGDVRIGIACTDPAQVVASPAETLPVADPGDLDRIAADIVAAARRHDAVGVVVGLPRTLDGTEGEAARRARAIADRIAAHLPVELWDERLSTVEAERVLLDAGLRRRARRAAADRVAASIILQGWVEARRRRRP